MSGTRPGGGDRPPVLERARRWLSRALLEPEYPHVAVEVRPRAVAAVRLSREGRRLGLGAATLVELPEGALDVVLTHNNVVDPGALRQAMQTALERVGALSGGILSLVLPDPAVRLALVPTAGLRGRRADAEEMIRFRLHKALPFDVRQARLAWDGARGEQALVAVAHEEVVRGYEAVVEDLGFEAGVVEAAILALASLQDDGQGDRLLVNWDDSYVSFLLQRGDQPLLARTLPGEGGAAGVARQAISTLQFYRDRLSGQGLSDVLVRAAACPVEEALSTLRPALDCEARLLQPWAALAPVHSDVPSQGLAGAAASALRRAS